MTHNRLTRRTLLQGLGAAAGASVLAPDWLRPAARAQAGAAGTKTTTKPPWYEPGLVDGDPIMDNQALYYLSTTYEQFADIGEVLDTTSRIRAEEPGSWPREWLRTSDRIRKIAETALAGGRRISAGEAFMRSANYDRAALMHHPDPRADASVPRVALRSTVSFDRALELLELPARPVRIPYESTTLRGIFYRSPAAQASAPLLIVFQGRDAWPEETKYLADAAMRRGMHCLQVHGPGQGVTLRVQGLPFRPDWERVVTPVVNYALTLGGVDPKRMGLLGISMAGALVPRAAAFERRLKVLVANPGVLSWNAGIRAQLAFLAPELMALLGSRPQAFNAAVEGAMRQSPLLSWGFKDMMWKHGVSTPLDLIADLKAYTNEPVVGRIQARTLVIDAEAESFTPGQARALYDALKSPKDFMLFTAQDTGLLHSQTAAFALFSQRLFDWLDENL